MKCKSCSTPAGWLVNDEPWCVNHLTFAITQACPKNGAKATVECIPYPEKHTEHFQLEKVYGNGNLNIGISIIFPNGDSAVTPRDVLAVEILLQQFWNELLNAYQMGESPNAKGRVS